MVRILVIEDEALIAQDIAAIAVGMGHEVCGVVGRHAKAMTMAVSAKPELILADIGLQDGDDGIATIKKIRHYLDVPVVFVTGNADRLANQITDTSVHCVAKPFVAETLRRAIRRALGQDGAAVRTEAVKS